MCVCMRKQDPRKDEVGRGVGGRGGRVKGKIRGERWVDDRVKGAGGLRSCL